ncbi:MAG: type II toxin-antitoxin system HicB family antitoxin [Verrucomicrobiae bacterium]|nr:type II toxin-antitoxin system HicB family antitoxin [Verrucomicrobiae bacterium]
MKITISMQKDDGWYTGQILEFPAVISQGRTKAELVDNLKDAAREYFASLSEGKKRHSKNVTLQKVSI